MTPTELRQVILADQDCAPHVVDETMGKVPGGAHAKDLAIATILNSKSVGATSRAVPCHLAKKLLIKALKWRGIVEAASNASHPAREAAYSAVALAEDARMDADYLDPAAGPLLDALVASGLIAPEQKAALETMCRVPSAITAADVSKALRGPWE